MRIKRIVAVCLLLCMVFCSLPPVQTNAATIAAEGTCGDNLTWTLSDDSILVISGVGEMVSYDYCAAPWYSYNSVIEKVVIEEGVTSIGDRAFYDCCVLYSITIPDSVQSIGESAFQFCSSLTSITLGNGVTDIGNDAFYYCTNLSLVTISDSVTTIASTAFQGCYSLTGIWVDENNKYYSNDDSGVLLNKDQTELYQAPMRLSGNYVIPHSVEYIGSGAFFGCEELTSVTMGSNVQIIDEGAFYQCNGLTSLEITDSVNRIGVAAFSACSNLASVTIGSGVTDIAGGAFDKCSNLQGIWVAESNVNYSNDSCGVLFDKEKTQLIQTPGGMTGDYVVPMGVTSIGYSAFGYCTGVTYVELPDSLQTIEDSAFFGCSGLTSVEVPDNVSDIGYNAFNSCTGLISVTLGTNLNSINAGAFQNCSNLTSVVIPASVTNIGPAVFLGAEMTGIWVDESNPCYSSDSSGVLFDKEKTELLQAPGGLSDSYTIPSSVVNISSCAFYECSALSAVTIPNSVGNISDGAFYMCSGLTTITYCGTEDTWNAISVGSSNEYLMNAKRRYHAYVNGICTICGDKEIHTHIWDNDICTVCSANITELAELSGDGKITVFDAQILAEANAGVRILSDEQWAALGDLSPQDIMDYLLGKFGTVQ